MQIRDVYFKVERTGPVGNIYVMPDCHFGSPAFLEKEYDRLATIIEKDPLAYLIFQGDLLDSNRPSTREIKRIAYSARREEYEQEDNRNAFWIDSIILPKLKRIIKRGRCLGMLDGDHFLQMENGMSSTQAICIKLGLPYLGDGQAILRFHFMGASHQRDILTIHMQHGIGGGGRNGNGVNKLEDLANIWEGVDIFVRGHSHKGFIFPISKYYIPPTEKAIKQRDIWMVNTPSFRTGIVMGKTDYAEQRNYSATAHKFPVIHLSTNMLGGKHRSNMQINITGELI